MIVKPPKRSSKRSRTTLDYAALENGQSALIDAQNLRKWTQVLQMRSFLPDTFERVKAMDVTPEWYAERVLHSKGEKGAPSKGIIEPFVVEKPEGLDMVMPDLSTTVRDVANTVGRDTPVEVIDVATQSEVADWNLGKWSDYFMSSRKDRIRNVISLEITNTPLGSTIQRPRIVRELDWVDRFWPDELKIGTDWPKVQLYCLMSVAESYTDWHIDFGGSSVFYHIINGAKVFYFIKPTTSNLKKYAHWSSSTDQAMRFLGDEVDQVYKVELQAGNTMIIPTGWIHAVFTPEDSLVIGGNFLHGMNASMQFTIHEIEKQTNVPQKFRFPYFDKLLWYSLRGYKEALESGKVLTPELKSIASMCDYLRSRLVASTPQKSRVGERDRRAIRDQIPKGIKAAELLNEVEALLKGSGVKLENGRAEVKTNGSKVNGKANGSKANSRSPRPVSRSPRKKPKLEEVKTEAKPDIKSESEAKATLDDTESEHSELEHTPLFGVNMEIFERIKA